jgi:F0F1-type ATP synthase assembly protein I
MPFHNPISENRRDGRDPSGNGSGGLKSLVQAEKLLQIAFLLPCAMMVGWALGWGVDRLFHTGWAKIPGLVLGIVAGMVTVIRMAMAAMSDLSRKDPPGDAISKRDGR